MAGMSREGGHLGPSAYPRRRLRVAVLTTHDPSPLATGDRIRTYELARALQRQGYEPHLIAVVSERFSLSSADRLLLGDTYASVTCIPRTGSIARMARLARAAALGHAVHHHYFWSAAAARQVRQVLQALRPDCTLVSQLYAAPYLPEPLWRSAVLDTQNIESERLATMAAHGSFARRRVARRTRTSTEELEAHTVSQMAFALAVSQADAAVLERYAPGRVAIVENGFSTRPRAASQAPSTPTFVFVGSLGYSANADAAVHLVRDIVPRVEHDAHFVVIGADPPRALRALAAQAAGRITLTGYVAEVQAFFDQATAVLVPIRQGGGTRIKVLDALAAGVAVISTSLGVSGLPVQPGRDVLVADDPRAFAVLVDALARDKEYAQKIGVNGQQAVAARFSWAATTSGLGEVVEGAVRRGIVVRPSDSITNGVHDSTKGTAGRTRAADPQLTVSEER